MNGPVNTIVEDITLETVKNILKKTKSKYLICSGGFFQNVSFKLSFSLMIYIIYYVRQ